MMRRVVTLSVAALVLFPQLLPAQATKLWLQSTYDDFEKGRAENVAIASDGYLEAAPELHSVLLTPSTYIWAAASDSQGNAYLATGSPATVLKVTPGGTSTKLFSTKDLSVQTVQVGPDGSVYAATLPSGKVYRIKPGQSDLDADTATVVFDPAKIAARPKGQTEYVWALAFDPQGALYIATGGPAAIYRIPQETTAGAAASPQLFFQSDEPHIRCLLFEPDGNLLAGTDGSGLVYRIGKDGKGVVIYDAPKQEVTALARNAGGVLYVADVGEKTKSALPPLPVQGTSTATSTATITIVTPGSVQASSTNSLVPEGSEIDELNPQGAPRKLWATHENVVYALQSSPQGLLVATGNQGRIYRVHEDGSYVDVAHTVAGQVTAFAQAPGGTYAATSNTGRLYKLSDGSPAQGTYMSDVFDAGVFSQWGRAEVNVSDGGASGPFELFLRSGNVENPDRNWNAWQKVTPNGTSTAVPSARFVQWKAVLQPQARIASVGIDYLPLNIAPVIDEIAVDPGVRVNEASMQPQQPPPVSISLPSAQSGVSFVQDTATSPISGFKDPTAVTARWAAHDDNGDDLTFDLYVRADGEKNWQLLKGNLKNRYYSFDSIRLPDGGYRMRVVASNASVHPPGTGLTGEQVSQHFVIDTTPPVLSSFHANVQGGGVHVTLEASDATSPISHAQYSLDAGPWREVDPVGTLSDSQTEHYDFTFPLVASTTASATDAQGTAREIVSDPNEHILSVRVYDRYDNAAAAKTLVH